MEEWESLEWHDEIIEDLEGCSFVQSLSAVKVASSGF
jgi:hypothetical protein